MLPIIAGQTAEPIRLNFFVDTHEWPCYRLKNRKFVFSKLFSHGQRRAIQLVNNYLFLGEGHYAVVKLARHVFTGEKVAVKVQCQD